MPNRGIKEHGSLIVSLYSGYLIGLSYLLSNYVYSFADANKNLGSAAMVSSAYGYTLHLKPVAIKKASPFEDAL